MRWLNKEQSITLWLVWINFSARYWTKHSKNVDWVIAISFSVLWGNKDPSITSLIPLPKVKKKKKKSFLVTLGTEKLMLAVSTAEAWTFTCPAYHDVGKAWPDRLSFECLDPMLKEMKHPPLTLFSLWWIVDNYSFQQWFRQSDSSFVGTSDQSLCSSSHHTLVMFQVLLVHITKSEVSLE